MMKTCAKCAEWAQWVLFKNVAAEHTKDEIKQKMAKRGLQVEIIGYFCGRHKEEHPPLELGMEFRFIGSMPRGLNCS